MEDPRIGLVLDHRYRITERIAAGGMGVVYRAERLGLGKPVAVKFLHRTAALLPDHRVRFEREAAAMSRLTHPNLVSIIDYGSWEGLPYLVMEYHQGHSLRKLIDEAGAMPPDRAVFIARQMLAGLASAHAAGVLHRDLKPSNVLLVGAPGEDLVKILDFGVAKLLDSGGGPTEVSVVAGRVIGTPAYMSPEHARAEPMDGRADIYSVGLLLYEMVTGKRPFQAEGKLGLLRAQVEDMPERPRARAPDLSPELDAAIWKAVEKERDQRWQSAEEFAAALAAVPEGRAGRQLAADVGPWSTPPSTPVPTPRPARSPTPRPESDSSYTDDLVAAGLVRRTRVLRGIALGLFFGAALLGLVYVAVERGLIDVEVRWLSWIPWAEFKLP
ncbi:MAG TPA: serine/threonine-protein kinase [Kofleriaceae bacterium]|nr:serine/threonine-protein kinase [Kofleriaceae bacterium]